MEVRRFVCTTRGCPRTTFAEGFPQLARAYARRTLRQAEALTEILQEEGLRIVTGAKVRSMDRSGEGVALSVKLHDSQHTFTAERLLVSIGRRPNTQEMGLEQAGVAIDSAGAVRVDRTLRTSFPHIWAAGDVIGRETESCARSIIGSSRVPSSPTPRSPWWV